jgi:hypothetical protein
LLGYRRSDVEAAIVERDELLAACGVEANRLATRIGELEREVRRLRDELSNATDRADEAVAALAGLGAELGGIRSQARAYATRMRLAALRQAAEVGRWAASLPAESAPERERLLAALTAAVERLGTEEEAVAASGNGHHAGPRGPLFEGMVEVEIGPFADFSQLVGFEDAARSIAATTELSIRRFSAGRATLAMNLKEPVELLRELEERCDLEFRIRDQRPGRVVLDVDGDES